MATSLTMRNFRTKIENAIQTALLLAYRKRLGSHPDAASLRARVSNGLDNEALAFLTANGRTYRFTPWSTAADDGDLVIRPNDNTGAKPGRWLKTDSAIASGYLDRCDLFEGADDEDAIQERLLSKKPAMLLHYDDTIWQSKSVRPGALHQATINFELFAVSTNMRSETAARQGSPYGAESSVDPGTAAMLGDAREVLSSYDLDTPFGLKGIGSLFLRSEAKLLEDYAGRTFIETLSFSVIASVSPKEDTTVVALDEPYSFKVQRQLAAAPSGEFDAENYAGGWTVPQGPRATAIAAGAAIIDGVAVSIGATSKTFTANKATWRDIVAGAWVFTETASIDAEPPLPAGGFRVGVTYTDSTSVTIDTVVCSTLYDYGPPDKVDPPLVDSIAVTPSSSSGGIGTTVQLTATATFEDGSTANVTPECVWSSTAPAVASVDDSGLVTRASAGTTQIVATLQGVASPPSTITST